LTKTAITIYGGIYSYYVRSLSGMLSISARRGVLSFAWWQAKTFPFGQVQNVPTSSHAGISQEKEGSRIQAIMGKEIKRHKFSHKGKGFVVREHSNNGRSSFFVFFDGTRKMNRTFHRLKDAINEACQSIDLHD
jgi:hypothetical protein